MDTSLSCCLSISFPDTAFAMWRMPGDSEWHSTGNIKAERTTLIANGLRIDAWPGSMSMPFEVCRTSTPLDSYREAVCRAAEAAAKRKGKTVISRCICGTFKVFDPEAIAAEYFRGFDNMFRFIFYHPLSGWWMGASPELLVERTEDGMLASRALAGTRRSGTAEPWDQKNIEEHNMVTADIVARINALGNGWHAEARDRVTLPYGHIEHLCTPVAVHPGNDLNILQKAVEVLHPTPAVGGLPREAALDDIRRLETAPRLFYGGTACCDDKAYVILRCVHFDSKHWCVYSGSGITPLSQPDAEWDETEAKAKPLVDILNKYSVAR